VVEAIENSDYCLLVTEPTPFGLHDLKLAVEAVCLLNIPCGLVVNRADIGDNKVFEYAEREGLPILLTIPFDRRIAQAYSRGKNIVEEFPEWRERFVALYHDIEAIITAKGKAVSCAK
jgi:MinD superfamily P-loop ATPase